MYKDLKTYLAQLERREELIKITAAVDPVLEIAELTDRQAKSPGGGKALLFENTGTDFAVVTNIFGSQRRIAMALGAESLDEIARRTARLTEAVTVPRESLGQKIRALGLLAEASRWLPKKRRGRGACQQVVLRGEDASLNDLPVLQCWPHDGGRFVTLPLVHTVDPVTGKRNVGMYRMQLFGPRTTGMHWHTHKTGERHYREYQRLGQRMPVSVCLGGDPAYTYAATAPMPDGMDEYLLAGFLRRRSVRLVRCVTNELWVPGDCDIVIEGYVDPAEAKTVEGPFGDHTGFYSLEDAYPVFHVTAITHRRGAIYPATVVGIPPQEDAWMSAATERIFLAPIRLALSPEIEDLHMPAAGTAHNLAVVGIRAQYAGQAFKVATGMWGAGQMMFNKWLIAAPAGVDIRDPQQMAAVLRGVRVPDDVMISRGVLDVLDHAATECGVGGKLAIDATRGCGAGVAVPEKLTPCHGVESVDASLVAKWSLLVLRASGEVDIERFLAKNGVRNVNFAVVVDPATSALTPEELLWIASANTDPGRDAYIIGNTLVADARAKTSGEGFPRRWPNVVASSPETIARVDRRWSEYAIGEFIASPSLRYAGLKLSEKAEV